MPMDIHVAKFFDMSYTGDPFWTKVRYLWQERANNRHLCQRDWWEVCHNYL